MDAIVSSKLTVAVWAVGVVESDTLNVSGAFVTPTVGVPLISPVWGFSASPAGSEPETSCQVYGVIPPVAVSAAKYPEPVCPLGSDIVVIASGEVAAGEIVRARFTAAAWA